MSGPAPPPTATPGRPYDGLLTQIMSTTLDQDYQAAADRRAGTPRRAGAGSGTVVVAVVIAAFGAMIGISAMRTQQQKPIEAAERAELVAHVQARQHRLDRMHVQLTDLQRRVAALQEDAGESRSLLTQTQAALETAAGVAGAAAVSGPGLEITTDNARGAGATGRGVILDTDLQALVNGLWAAGAEAIAINGHRLTSLTAIRTAGRAITVDDRSLTPPYVIDAVGDPATLPARLLETAGGQAWLALTANFGIRFDPVSVADLLLPADPNAQLHRARPVTTR
jgi:uncharacterized protein YlxW (UPF0749 family)